MDRRLNKTLEISSRRASFFNFDKGSRLNRDRRPRVPASRLLTNPNQIIASTVRHLKKPTLQEITARMRAAVLCTGMFLAVLTGSVYSSEEGGGENSMTQLYFLFRSLCAIKIYSIKTHAFFVV